MRDTSGLIHINDRPQEEQDRMRKKSAIMSGMSKELKRQEKRFADLLAIVLNHEIEDNYIRDKMMEKYPMLPPTYKGWLVLKMIKYIASTKKIKLNDYIKAMEFIRDTVGEKPKGELEINNRLNLSNDDDSIIKDYAKRKYNLEEKLIEPSS